MDPRVIEAIGLAPESNEDEIAHAFRTLIGLPAHGTTNAAMWVRFLEAVEHARTLRPDGPRGDRAELAHFTVGYAIVREGQPGDDRFGMEAWDRELAVGFAESDDRLRMLVLDEIAPRLARAGLYALL